MMIQGRFPILFNSLVRGATHRLCFHAPQIAQSAQAGQFLTIRVGEGHDPLLRRPFGVHRLNEDREGSVEILYRVVGKGTAEMTRLQSGEMIDVLGPIGTGFSHYPYMRNHIMVAGGIGAAPFPILAGHIRETIPGARLIYIAGGKTEMEIAGERSAGSFCDKTIFVTEDGSRGTKGLVTQPLEEILKSMDPAKTVVYACGPMPMLAAVSKLALPLGVTCEVSLESQMACGMGTCLGCVTETIPSGEEGLTIEEDSTTSGDKDTYQRVCAEGPVFNAKTIAWGKALGRK